MLLNNFWQTYSSAMSVESEHLKSNSPSYGSTESQELFNDDDDDDSVPNVTYQNPSAAKLCIESLIFRLLFCVLCFLSGQYITDLFKKNKDNHPPDPNENPPDQNQNPPNGNMPDQETHQFCKFLPNICLSVVGLSIFFVQILCHLANISLGSWIEVCRIAPDLCKTFPQDHNVSNCSLPFQYWKFSVASTIASYGSFVSYVLITVMILIPMNSCFHKCFCKFCKPPREKENDVFRQACCLAHRKAFSQTILSPFSDETKDKSKKVFSLETLCFCFHYVIVLSFFLCKLVFGVAYITMYLLDNKHSFNETTGNQSMKNFSCVINIVDTTRVAFQLNALFCVIQSCFIFSKIVYIVAGKFDELEKEMDKVDDKIEGLRVKTAERGEFHHYMTKQHKKEENLKQLLDSQDNEEVNKGRYYLLQKIDQKFIDEVKPTLELYGVWFIFHWILHSLTSVLLSAVIVELTIDVVGDHVNKTNALLPSTMRPLYVPYIAFCMLIHTYLFLYPCFRAASIASARDKMIKNISKRHWRHIPLAVKEDYTQYLKSQNFGFKVSIFCADISCGFSLAFVSLFIAVCGGFLNFFR